MAVLTISRQLGSHGGRIARALARDLGYAFADKALINGVIRQYGLTRLDVIYNRKPKLRELFNTDSAETIRMMNQTIEAIAARGDVVILGRGGFKVLQGMADVLNVFVMAPDELRAERIARRDQISTAEAAGLIRADDELRERFVRLFYNAGWAEPSAYDLVVDTGTQHDGAAKAEIAAAVQGLPAPAAGVRTAAGLVVDPVLRATVAEALARRARPA